MYFSNPIFKVSLEEIKELDENFMKWDEKFFICIKKKNFIKSKSEKYQILYYLYDSLENDN